MERGTVKWFSQEKGYGFIQSSSGQEYFVHSTKTPTGGLEPGQMVEFEIGEGRKGPEATNVQILVEEQE